MEFFEMNFNESFIADLYNKGVSCGKFDFDVDMNGTCPWGSKNVKADRIQEAPQALKSQKTIFKLKR